MGGMVVDHSIGLAALALAAMAWWRQDRSPATDTAPPLPGRRFWLFCGVVFLVLSTGHVLILYPTAHIDFPLSALPTPLFALIELVPATAAFAAPYRSAPGVFLAVAVLAGWGLERLYRSARGPGRAGLMAGVILLFVAEGAWSDITAHPLDMTPVEIPQVYRDLAERDDDGGVLTIPFWNHRLIPSLHVYQLWQRYHGHPLHHSDEGHIDTQHLTPFTYELLLAMGVPAARAPIITDEGIPARWIVVHMDALAPNQQSTLGAIIGSEAELVRSYEDESTQLWEVRPEARMR